jgi:NAD(P)-dependent dehydrogenase (short-subunit alcohol dehydrogenase family)
VEYNPFSLEGKKILITGASSGIGRAAAIECSKIGASVYITGRNIERLEETLSKMSGDDNHAIQADLTKSEDIQKIVSEIPVLDGCVNNAGIAKPLIVQFISNEALNEVFSINTFAPIILVQGIVRLKKIVNGGSIVFTSSISGLMCSAIGASLYSASKSAINGFIKGAALDLSAKGIRVNCVNPGMIDTNIFNEGQISKEQLEEDKKRYPLKRYGKPEEVAYAIIYLLSDASKWMTGSNIVIDGGYTLN